MDEPCPIQVLSFSCIKNETTEVVSQKSSFKGSPQIKDFLISCFILLTDVECRHSLIPFFCSTLHHHRAAFLSTNASTQHPYHNQALKKVIERAKANNVPADVIKRAIEKAKSNDTENYSSARYEGFGSGGGSSIIIDCLTDNPNRTIANLRACFNKSHAKLGVGGSVSFNYEHLGLIVIDYDDEEAMMDALIMAEVDLKDVEVEDGVMTITVEPQDLSKAKEAIEQLIPDVEFKVMEDTMLANDTVELSGDDLELFRRLVTLLDDVDDVQNIYHNVSNLNA